MSFLAKVKAAPKNMISDRAGYGPDGHGILGFAVDKGERYAGALAFGAMKGYYRERAVWQGYGADLWIGGALTLGAAVLQILSGGQSRIAPHAERVGDAGVMSFLNSWGAGWGTKKAGRVVAVSDAGKSLPGSSPILGWIPPAKDGDYLSADEIQRNSAPR